MHRYCIQRNQIKTRGAATFLVEDRHTGEFVSYHKTMEGAMASIRRLRRLKRQKHPPKHRSAWTVSGGLPSLGKRR